jgi:hypothetical protein
MVEKGKVQVGEVGMVEPEMNLRTSLPAACVTFNQIATHA